MTPRCLDPNRALDSGPVAGPMYSTEVPRPKLGLGFRPGSVAPFFISLLYTALINYKSESRPLTNARWDFPEQLKKTNPTYHRLLGSFQETSLLGIFAWVGTKFQSPNLSIPLSPKHPLRIDNIGPLIALTMVVIMISPLT